MSGNIFPESISFTHAMIPDIIEPIAAVLDKIGVKYFPIGSAAYPIDGKVSNDLDIMVDLNDLRSYFDPPEAFEKTLRSFLSIEFKAAGFRTAQTGVCVHVAVPIDDSVYQVDIMTVQDAENISFYHQHNVPRGSKYKGFNKILALARLAKEQGLMWSPYKGLFKRSEPTKIFLSSDPTEVANILLGPGSDPESLRNVESILNALGSDRGSTLLNKLQADINWKEF